MVMTVKLFKNSKVDGITRLGKWADKSAQISYFDTLTSKTYTTNTVKLGDSLRINDKLSNLLGYGYGYIDYGDGFRYYFLVGDLIMVTETMTDISYTIDCYDTAITQTNVSLARATISRAGQLYNSQNMYPYNPIFYNHVQKDYPTNYAICFSFTVVDGDNINNAILLPKATLDFSAGLVSSKWIEWLNSAQSDYKFTATDIFTASLVPIFGDFVIGSRPNYDWTVVTLAESGDINRNNAEFYVTSETSELYIQSDKTKWKMENNDITSYSAIQDCRGNIIFRCEDYATYIHDSMAICYSGSSIDLRLSFHRDDEYFMITIPSENIDIYVNTWLEYQYRQRQYDIELRSQQIDQQLASSLVNIGNNALSGGMSGGMAGIGGSAGAVAGIATGLIGSLGDYAINSYYNGENQRVKDNIVKNTNDTLNQRGNNVCFILGVKLAGPCIESWDSVSKNSYNDDITNNGYYVNIITEDFSSFITEGPITADVEILGDIPQVWKDQIHDRFSNGVMIV